MRKNRVTPKASTRAAVQAHFGLLLLPFACAPSPLVVSEAAIPFRPQWQLGASWAVQQRDAAVDLPGESGRLELAPTRDSIWRYEVVGIDERGNTDIMAEWIDNPAHRPIHELLIFDPAGDLIQHGSNVLPSLTPVVGTSGGVSDFGVWRMGCWPLFPLTAVPLDPESTQHVVAQVDGLDITVRTNGSYAIMHWTDGAPWWDRAEEWLDSDAGLGAPPSLMRAGQRIEAGDADATLPFKAAPRELRYRR